MAKSVAERIVKRRDALKLKDSQLARVLGVTRSTVHGWTHGDHEPTLASLRRIARALKCDVAELLGLS
jgi:transcriptional regulator with XRE-family HTH domain